MTNEQINRAIAEHVGWTDVHFYEDDAGPPIHCGYPPGIRHYATIPRYSTDLNALHDALQNLTEVELFRYADEVCDLTRDSNHDTDIQTMLMLSAKELAECYVRAIGK